MKKFNIERKRNRIQSFCCKRIVPVFLAASILLSSSLDLTAFGAEGSKKYAHGAAVKELISPFLDGNKRDPGSTGDSDKITVSKFGIEILDGYNRVDHDDKGNPVYVWEAENPMEGHSFIFNILFETSGEGNIPSGSVNITIPRSVFENGLDQLEMSVPYYTEITENLGVEHSWAYKFDEGGNIVIYNIKDVPAGNAYNFNMAYTTTSKTYYYEDMKPSDDIYAELVMYDSDPNDENTQSKVIDEKNAGPLHTAIDTTAKINKTTKNAPKQLYTEWNKLWGDDVMPEDPDDFYYLVWEIESVVDTNSTQFYDFSLSDLDGSFTIKSVTPSDKAGQFDQSQLKVLGYNYSGNGNAYLKHPAMVKDQDIFGVRRDYVLTAVPKEWYDSLDADEKIVLQNTVDATVHPNDNEDEDEDTTVSADQTYTLQKPKFTAPNGSYKITKKGDRRNYLLDKFAYDDDKMPDYVYDISVTGYSYSDTYEYTENGNNTNAKYVPEEDHKNYGKKKLHYEITDEDVAIAGLVGEKSGDAYELTKDEYYFTRIDLNYDISMVVKDDERTPIDESFDDDRKIYNLTAPDANSGYTVYLDIYGEFEGKGGYRKIAEIAAYRAGKPSSIIYADGMEGIADITYISDRKISIKFADDVRCTGYKLVTSDECYYSAGFNIQTGIQLKRTAGLLKWINEAYYKNNTKENEEDPDRITELQLTNTAKMAVYHETNGSVPDSDKNLIPASKQSDRGKDYQNESRRQSTITKNVTAVKNNPLYKRYEISWRIDISEIVLSEGSTPVTQYGGTFYDLLPQGSSVDLSTVQVYKENNILVESTAKTMAGTGNRVLLRVVVEEDQPGNKYSLVFTSYHTWEDISAFGTNVLNPAAFVSGNDDIANLSDGSRGNERDGSIGLITDNILSTGDFDEADIDSRAIFNYATYTIKALVASNVGVSKSVKNAKEGSYSTETIVDQDIREYSYRLRFENGTTTKSIDNIFVDFLEAYTAEGIRSQWKGKLRSIDVTNLLSKHIIPVVYYSTTPFIVEKTEVYYESNGQRIYLVDGDSEITGYKAGTGKEGCFYRGIRNFLPTTSYNGDNTVTGAENGFWKVLDASCLENGIYNLPEDLADKDKITAVAIDFTYADKSRFAANEIGGNDPNANKDTVRVRADGRYIMGMNEAAYVIMTMDSSGISLEKADDFAAGYRKDHADASEAEIEEAYKAYLLGFDTYNDVFIATRYYDRMQNDPANAVDTFIEQSYTTVRHRIRSDFHMLKVNNENTAQTIGGITFNLKGVSDYGTPVDIMLTTNSNGRLEFEDLEIGKYTLVEYNSGRDWLFDSTEYTVCVNADGSVTVDPEPYQSHYENYRTDHSSADDPFIVENTPRIHADISFDKRQFNGMGAEFGKVVPGARFMLSGTSKYNTAVTKFAVSDVNGRVFFEDVEWGTEYELKEIEAPDGYALSNVVYRVIVDKNGNWSITDISYDPADPDDYTLLEGDSSNGYTLGNEKYQEFYLLKLSTQAVGVDEEYLLDGAEFSLTGTTDDGVYISIDSVSGYTSEYGPGTVYFGNLPYGTYYLKETKAPVYSYTDPTGKKVDQEFYCDPTVYKVIVDENGVTINGLSLYEGKDDETGETFVYEDLYAFYNIPKGNIVVVHKAWVDNFVSAEERAEKVHDPDIAISKKKPDAFRLIYAIFDYNFNDNRYPRSTKLKTEMVGAEGFERYIGKVTVIDDNTLRLDSGEVTVSIISTADSPMKIYGWLDSSTKTYYWYTEATGGKIVGSAQDLFSGNNNNKVKKVSFSGVNFSETSSFAYMFNGCGELVSVTDLVRPEDVSSDVNLQNMFSQCKKLKDLDLSEFYTHGATNMQYMFNQCASITRFDISHFDTSQVESMAYMFAGCTSVVAIDLGKTLNTKKTRSVSHLFDACTVLTSLSITEIDVNNATVDFMFCNCKAIQTVPKLIRSSTNPTSMEAMYMNCLKLQTLDLSEFYTTGATSMKQMFSFCNVINRIDVSRFDTKNVTNMDRMFQQCKAVTELNVTSFNTSKVENMWSMFDTCSSLKELDLSSFTMESLKNVSNDISAATMFCNCTELVTIYANKSFDLSTLSYTANSGNMFQNDAKLALRQRVSDKPENKRDYGIHAFVNGLHGDVVGYFTEKEPPATSGAGTDNSEAAALRRIVSDFAKLRRQVRDVYDAGIQNKTAPIADDAEDTTADGDNYRNSRNHNNESYHDCANGDSFFVFKSKKDLDKLQEEIEKLRDKIADSSDRTEEETAKLNEQLTEYEEIYTLVRNITIARIEKEVDGEVITEEIWKADEWIYVFCNVVGEGYYAWEENVPDGYESDFDNVDVTGDGDGSTTIISGGAATITNKAKKIKLGTLTICKVLSNADMNAAEQDKDLTYRFTSKYQFEITLSNMASGFAQSLDAYYFDTRKADDEKAYEKISVTFDENGKATVQIQSGYSLKFIDLPEGTDYTVQEVQVDEETVSSTSISIENGEGDTDDVSRTVTGKISGKTDLSVKYDNAIEADLREKGAFKLEKRVKNENGDVDPDYEYVFTIQFENLIKNTEYKICKNVTVDGKDAQEVVQTFRSDSDRKAAVVVKLKHGDVLTFPDIPYEAVYHVVEADSEAYISSYEITGENGDVKESDANSNANTSLSTKDQTMGDSTNGDLITYTNNIVKTQKVTLTKRVGGETEKTDDGKEKQYTFYAEFFDLGAGYLLDAGDMGTFPANAQGTASFRFFLKAQEAITFTNIPVGASYTIYEECEGKLIPYYEVSYTDEASGNTQKASPAPASPSIRTADEIKKDIEKAETEVSTRTAAKSLASSLLTSEKNTLNIRLAELVAMLSDGHGVPDEMIAAFTADNCVDENGNYTAEYLEAKAAILEAVGETQNNDLDDLEKKVSDAAKVYADASKALDEANEALVKARGNSYISGTVELHKDTDITFYNNDPTDLTIDKTVTGAFGDKSKEFRFKVIFTYNGEPFEGSYKAEAANGAIITDPDYQTVTADEYGFDAGGTAYFVLKHGSRITFKGLPYGTTYEIIEEEYNDYKTSYATDFGDGADGQKTEGNIAKGTLTEQKEITVHCTNLWDGISYELPLTGAGITGNMIYKLGLFIMTCGLIGSALCYRRRRRNRHA